MIRTVLWAAAVGIALGVIPAAAQVPLSGSFTASQACPALQSIRQQSNPGNVTVVAGQSYRVTGKNRPDATFFQIVVDGAQPSQRWVAAECGQVDAAAAGTRPTPTSTGGSTTGVRATHVLALGWEPEFCSQHQDKAECASETAQSAEAKQLSLHGLWPQPRGKAYCNVDAKLKAADLAHQWGSLPEPDLGPATRQHLAAVMPGVQSGLERHEWIVHGTCFGGSADAYFNRAATLVDQVNATPVAALFVSNIGKTVSADDIRGAFDQAFGAGAGGRVLISCAGQGARRTISELTISLAGDVSGTASIGDLIQAAAAVAPGCPSGIVERPAH